MQVPNMIKRLKKPNAPWRKYYNHGDENIKIPNDTIYEFFLKICNKYANYPAIEYFGQKTLYKNLLKQVDECAKALKKEGIKKQDVVTICMPNTPEVLIAFYAINKLGAVANMIHPLSAEEEIKLYLKNNHAKMLIFIDMCFEKINNIIDDTKVKKAIYVSPSYSMGFGMTIGYKLTKGRKIKKPLFGDKYITWRNFIKNAKNDDEVKTVSTSKDDPAAILHSGGSTGMPKGILLSNKNFNVLCIQGSKVFEELTPNDSVLAIMPCFHGFGIGISMHVPFYFGMKVILVPQFNAKEFDKLINKTKPSILLGVPTLFDALCHSNNVPNLDLSYLKYIISGGDTLTESLEKRINDYCSKHNANIKLSQGYGMTECLAAVSGAVGITNKKGSIGAPLIGNYLKIIDPETRRTLGPNEIGEICVNGPTVMIGYLDNEIETNEILQIHDDGHVWLHTGDMGYMDTDGIFFYKQRLKRMIISSGYNVYPSHVENIINQHPAVLTSTVIGIPHPYKMEVPKAFIILKSGYISLGNTENSIRRWCEKHLSQHAIPKEFEFRKSLPKTLVGKIDFNKLQKEEIEKRSS